MKKKIMIISSTITILILIFATFSVYAANYYEQKKCIYGNILYVGGNGPGNYSSIQNAIDDANNGDKVYVYEGIYNENINIYKKLDLVGEDKNTTIISPGKSYHSKGIIDITADRVSLIGFSVQSFPNNLNCTNHGIALLECDYTTIRDNIITVKRSEGHPQNGIYMDVSNHNIIVNNVIDSCTEKGLEITLSHDNNISLNIIKNNQYSGISIWGSSNNVISGNIINNNNYCGIYGAICGNFISNNEINDNGYAGIRLVSKSCFNTVFSNNITDNQVYGIIIEYNPDPWIPPSEDNHIYRNNFVNNNQNAYDKYFNHWCKLSLGGSNGNYWDDYNGEDRNGDGFGDTSYVIPGGSNKDRFPFMEPIDINNIVSYGTEFEIKISIPRIKLFLNSWFEVFPILERMFEFLKQY